MSTRSETRISLAMFPHGPSRLRQQIDLNRERHRKASDAKAQREKYRQAMHDQMQEAMYRSEAARHPMFRFEEATVAPIREPTWWDIASAKLKRLLRNWQS